MATFLEQGIAAAQKGRKTEARAFFQQVLQADDKNERAWLWMSEVADTTIEQIAYVERALAINPGNKTSQMALKKLKTELESQTVTVGALPDRPAGLLKNAPRKPFRLGEEGKPAVNGQRTVAMPLSSAGGQNLVAELRQASNGLSPAVGGRGAVKSAQTPSFDSIPMLPALIFGTLAVTAIGGIAMIILLALLS